MLLELDGAPRAMTLTHLPVCGVETSPDYLFAKAFQRRCNVARSFVPGRDMSAR